MTERGMIFNAEMVRALLDGRKTQTRRIMKAQPSSGVRTSPFVKSGFEDGHGKELSCPFGAVGDRIWVRETWAEAGAGAPELQLYRANYPDHVPSYYENLEMAEDIRWRPSIHMPRWASRITLEITKVRVERLKHVPRSGIIAEGYPAERAADGGEYDPFLWYRDLWESIYGEGSWQANPWVWVIEFRRIEGE